MNRLELIELLSSASEDEVFIDSDGLLYDIEIGHEAEQLTVLILSIPHV